MPKVNLNKAFRPYTIEIQSKAEHETLTELCQDPDKLKVKQSAVRDPYRHGVLLETCTDLPFQQRRFLDHIRTQLAE